MKRTAILLAGLAGASTFASARAHAQDLPSAQPVTPAGSPFSPAAANTYRTSLGAGFFGSGGDSGGGNGLLKAGLITLGAGYLASVLGGAIALATVDYNVLRMDYTTYQEDGFGAKQATRKMYIPIVGPWMALSENLDAQDLCHQLGVTCGDAAYVGGDIGFIVGGVAQATGVVLTVVGLLNRDDSKAGDPPRQGVLLSAGAVPGGGIFVVGGGF